MNENCDRAFQKFHTQMKRIVFRKRMNVHDWIRQSRDLFIVSLLGYEIKFPRLRPYVMEFNLNNKNLYKGRSYNPYHVTMSRNGETYNEISIERGV